MVERLDNWPILLSRFLKARRTMPFQWGENDCMMFAAKAVEAVTGHDFFSAYPSYSDAEGAEAIISDNGGSITNIIGDCLGASGSKDVLLAKRGDVVVAHLPLETAGVVDDSGMYFCVVTAAGLQRNPLKKASLCWSY